MLHLAFETLAHSTGGRRLRSSLMRLLRRAPSSPPVPRPAGGPARCEPRSLPAPRPSVPTASLTLPTRLTRCLTHASHIPKVVLWMSEHSSTNHVLEGRGGSGAPLSPRDCVPRPVCQRSDEGVHLIAAGSPPLSWRRHRLTRWRVWGRKIDHRWRRAPSRAPRPPRCQSPCRRSSRGS